MVQTFTLAVLKSTLVQEDLEDGELFVMTAGILRMLG